MPELFNHRQLWALLSAMFVALTAIFAKIGIQNINSDFATFILLGDATRFAVSNEAYRRLVPHRHEKPATPASPRSYRAWREEWIHETVIRLKRSAPSNGSCGSDNKTTRVLGRIWQLA